MTELLDRTLPRWTPRIGRGWLCPVDRCRGPASVVRHFQAIHDRLINRHDLVTIRAKRHTVVEGKTLEIRPEQARKLLLSIDTSNQVGLRDRAILAIAVGPEGDLGEVGDRGTDQRLQGSAIGRRYP